MSRIAVAFVSGLIFGAGLLLSQMSNPAKVVGFLDISRNWDPSLAFVMAGAVGTFGLAYRLAMRSGQPWLANKFFVPDTTGIDARLVGGALIFGAGWGLSGFCPGPAVVGATFGDTRVVAFIAALVFGTLATRRIFRRSEPADMA
jgi:uncharacterized protein